MSWFFIRFFPLFAQLLSRDLYITFPLHYYHCWFKPRTIFRKTVTCANVWSYQNLIHFFIIMDSFNVRRVKRFRFFNILLHCDFIKKEEMFMQILAGRLHYRTLQHVISFNYFVTNTMLWGNWFTDWFIGFEEISKISISKVILVQKWNW